ncbi:aplysianin-A-like [Mya arenaria]|uniref:aplysianin-A-like n=1 Tax=Mya arenaria TaxID=6604 RepID=UPI0022E1739A|nr:aplysianin-A-like [Mya arenaria]
MAFKGQRCRHELSCIIIFDLLLISVTGFVLDGTRAEDLTSKQTCEDVAIIGAGISGSYAAWRLRDHNLSISVYEYSNRVGGRFRTIRFPNSPDINVELGAMRFLPAAHQLLVSTIQDLGLAAVEFKPGFGVEGKDIMYMRGQHFHSGDIKKGHIPYNLHENERNLDLQHFRWEALLNGTDFPANGTFNDYAFLHTRTKDGLELYKQSARAAYFTMGISKEMSDLIRDVVGFRFMFGDVSSSNAVPLSNPNRIPTGPRVVQTVKEGMEAVPHTLIDRFLQTSHSHKLHINRELTEVIRTGATYTLRFKETVTTNGITTYAKNFRMLEVCAKKVVLTVPRLALSKVTFSGLSISHDLSDSIENAVKDVPAFKIFLAYDTPWWRTTNVTHAETDLPNRQVYDFGTSARSSTSVLAAAYGDMDIVKFWREVQSRGPFMNCLNGNDTCPSEAAVKHVTNFLAEIFQIPLESIPTPVDGAISIWDQFPFGGGWHVWMPGYNWDDVRRDVLQPSPTDHVYFATGSYAPGETDSWSNNALETVERVLKLLSI